jgi:hypothetical protein
MLVNYITAVWSQWIGDPNSVRSYLHRKGYQKRRGVRVASLMLTDKNFQRSHAHSDRHPRYSNRPACYCCPSSGSGRASFFREQLRACVSSMPVAIERMTPNVPFHSSFTLSNGGPAPAYSVQYDGVLCMAKHPLRNNFFIPKIVARTDESVDGTSPDSHRWTCPCHANVHKGRDCRNTQRQGPRWQASLCIRTRELHRHLQTKAMDAILLLFPWMA